MSFNKTTFNHTVISSQFLNDFQDEVIDIRDDLTRLQTTRQYKQLFVMLDNESIHKVPSGNGLYESNCGFSLLLPAITPMIGDVVIGTSPGNYIGTIDYVNLSANSFRVVGTGKKLINKGDNSE